MTRAGRGSSRSRRRTSSVVTSRYTAVSLTAPTVTIPSATQWLAIINGAGPRGGRSTGTDPESQARQRLVAALPSISAL